MQDINLNQLKLKVNETWKDEKITSFKSSNDEDVINEAYLDEKLSKLEGHLSLLEKITTNLKYLPTNSLWKKVLLQRAVKTIIQILYDKGLFDFFPNADVLKAFLFVVRRRPDI